VLRLQLLFEAIHEGKPRGSDPISDPDVNAPDPRCTRIAINSYLHPSLVTIIRDPHLLDSPALQELVIDAIDHTQKIRGSHNKVNVDIKFHNQVQRTASNQSRLAVLAKDFKQGQLLNNVFRFGSKRFYRF